MENNLIIGKMKVMIKLPVQLMNRVKLNAPSVRNSGEYYDFIPPNEYTYPIIYTYITDITEYDATL